MKEFTPHTEEAKRAKLFVMMAAIVGIFSYTLPIVFYYISFFSDDYFLYGYYLDYIVWGNTFVTYGAYIVAATFFIIWMKKAYSQLKYLGVITNHSPAATIWSWFVPLLNIFLPFSILNEMREELENYLYQNYGSSISIKRFLLGWWIFGLIRIFGIVAYYFIQNYFYESVYIMQLVVYFISLIAFSLSAYFIMRFISAYTTLEVKVGNEMHEIDSIL